MSLRARALNAWLRRVEKPRMRRAKGAEPLRRNLEFQARWLFHPPRGTNLNWHKLGPIDVLNVVPQRVQEDRILLYFHGGGFVFGSPDTHSAMVGQLAKRVQAQAILPKYRLAPEHPFPAAFEDATTVWHALVEQGGDPQNIIVGGDSAGGCLALALLGDLIAKSAPLPAAVFAFSPLTDMTFSGASFTANTEAEAVLAAERAHELGQMYLNGQNATDPKVSPLHADFEGAPPVWLCVGDTEILYDDTIRLRNRLAAQNVDVTCEIYSDLPHVWPIFHNILAEAGQTLDTAAAWLTPKFGSST